MLSNFLAWLSNSMTSDFFSGGIALGVVGVLTAGSAYLWRAIYNGLQRRLILSVTFDNRSAAFRHLCVWLDQSGVLARSRLLRVSELSFGAERELYVPAPGVHWFIHDGLPCLMVRDISEKIRVGDPIETRPMETITLRIPFGRVETVRGWVAEGAAALARQDRIGPALHIYREAYWDKTGEAPRRSITTVASDDDRTTALLEDVRWFYGARDWYAERGIPWRRGYLLYGPPGTGKSSVIRAVASELDLDIAALDLGDSRLTDEGLRAALVTAPVRSMLVIEDIDAIFAAQRESERKTGVSFSGLLNAIDGVAAQEGRALFMTTNHRERLDPALIRPGRVDRHVEMGLIGAETAARLFRRFFPGQDRLAAVFAARLSGKRLVPSAVQGWLIAHAHDPERASTAEGLLGLPVVAGAAGAPDAA